MYAGWSNAGGGRSTPIASRPQRSTMDKAWPGQPPSRRTSSISRAPLASVSATRHPARVS